MNIMPNNNNIRVISDPDTEPINTYDIPVSGPEREFLTKTHAFDRLFFNGQIPKKYYIVKLALHSLANKIDNEIGEKNEPKLPIIVQSPKFMKLVNKCNGNKLFALRKVLEPAVDTKIDECKETLTEASNNSIKFKSLVQELTVEGLLEAAIYPYTLKIEKIENPQKRVSYKLMYDSLKKALTHMIKDYVKI